MIGAATAAGASIETAFRAAFRESDVLDRGNRRDRLWRKCGGKLVFLRSTRCHFASLAKVVEAIPTYADIAQTKTELAQEPRPRTDVGAAVVIGNLAGWPVFIGPDAVAFAIGFSGAVGVFFGWYPATKASRMEPVATLRVE